MPAFELKKIWQLLDGRMAPGPEREAAMHQARLALLASVLCLCGLYSIGFRTGLGGWLHLPEGEYWAWWWASNWVFFVLLPCLFSYFVLGLNPLDFGCRLKDARGHGKLYAAILVLALAGDAIASQLSMFVNRYPLNRAASADWTHLVVWELAYASQFLALEFFFRGFMLRTTERALGSLSVFVMAIPYCLIHATKPWPEFVASIAAGLVLGAIALTTRSIWGGVILHIAVAWAMDFVALFQSGRFPSLTR
jgi:membrane protease YdiL (CAAX protease family)